MQNGDTTVYEKLPLGKFPVHDTLYSYFINFTSVCPSSPH